jgi:predicted SAM-dependent methyltransferase
VDKVKLNIGCGTDYRNGFVNIDGSDAAGRVDLLVELREVSLLEHFSPGSVSHILAQDVLEHFFHWEATRILNDFFSLLESEGTCEIRVPDCERILKRWYWSVEKKLVALFGGQDVPQGLDSRMDDSRRENPEFFCHKYGWTRKRMREEMNKVGFLDVRTYREGSNLVAYATKP